MRKHITVEQLNELSDKGKDNLRSWWKPRLGDIITDKSRMVRYYSRHISEEKIRAMETTNLLKNKETLPLLSIGQMIEFLDEHHEVGVSKDDGKWLVPVGSDIKCIFYPPDKELADALWAACVEVLEE